MSSETPEVTAEREGWAKVPLWLLAAVNPTAVVVYAHLTSYAWMREGARPAMARIAAERGLSVRTVQRAINDLEAAGAIDITQRWSEVGQQLPSKYHVRLTQREGDKSDGVPRTGDTPEGDKSVTGGVTNLADETDSLQPDSEKTEPRKRSNGSATTRGTRLPEGWMPDDETKAAMKAELVGWSDGDFWREHRVFADYWADLTGARAIKIGWNATWRNWMRRAYRDGGGNVHGIRSAGRGPQPAPRVQHTESVAPDPDTLPWANQGGR